MKLAALLYDISLLMLPPDLQTGQGALDPEFYVTTQNHPRLGAILLEPFSFLREATIMIVHHHERWDGSGYPYGLRGEFISFGVRILAVADAFEAMQVPHVRDRSHRDRIALRILRVASGMQFTPLVVDTLIELFEETKARCAGTILHRNTAGVSPTPPSKFETHPSHFARQETSPPEDPCCPYRTTNRTCHWVHDVPVALRGGMRTSTDFARCSPLPARSDGKTVAARNSPLLVNSAPNRPGGAPEIAA